MRFIPYDSYGMIQTTYAFRSGRCAESHGIVFEEVDLFGQHASVFSLAKMIIPECVLMPV